MESRLFKASQAAAAARSAAVLEDVKKTSAMTLEPIDQDENSAVMVDNAINVFFIGLGERKFTNEAVVTMERQLEEE